MKSMRLASGQRGVVLLIALIALVAMTLAGIALMRSVDTANVIAGNFAFKEATLHATDNGVESAITTLNGLSTITSNDGSAAVANQYFPVRQTVDTLGIPTTVDWTAVPTVAIASTGNSVQYVIERMCEPVTVAGVVTSANGPVQSNRSDVSDFCVTAPQCSPGVSINTPPFCVAGDIYYRITARVTGPRGTVSVVQAVVTR